MKEQGFQLIIVITLLLCRACGYIYLIKRGIHFETLINAAFNQLNITTYSRRQRYIFI